MSGIKKVMKKIILITAVNILLFSCKKQRTVEATTQENEIEKGQCLVNIKGQNMSVCFDGLELDNRCPVNALCITRGVAVANFTATYLNTTVQFKLADAKSQSAYANDTTINNVRITLKNVTPWPGEPGGNLQVKKVTLLLQ